MKFLRHPLIGIPVIALWCFLTSSAFLFGIVRTWEAGIMEGLLAFFLSPILSLFGIYFLPITGLYSIFLWNAFSPHWKRRQCVLFAVFCTAMGALGMALLIGVLTQKPLVALVFSISGGMGAAVGVWLVSLLKKP